MSGRLLITEYVLLTKILNYNDSFFKITFLLKNAAPYPTKLYPTRTSYLR